MPRRALALELADELACRGLKMLACDRPAPGCATAAWGDRAGHYDSAEVRLAGDVTDLARADDDLLDALLAEVDARRAAR